jgi:aryl-alcohol dehydrogenase-like predicted oxidoreductase
MPHIHIPATDLSVSPICLGTGGFGSSIAVENVDAILDEYVDLGGNFVDTAWNYGDWVPGQKSPSEKAIGKWTKSRGNRDRIVLATKAAHPLLDGKDEPRMNRASILGDLEDSLRHLQTDRIDLFWLHTDDPKTPIESILPVLEEAKTAGKIRHYAASNWRVSRLWEAKEFAEANGLAGFVADQVLWNAAVIRTYPYGSRGTAWMDEERFIFHEMTGMAAISYQSQAFGLFQRMSNGTLDAMNPGFRGFYRLGPSSRRHERMQQVASDSGLTVSQVVLGWLRGQPFPTVPIIGPQNTAQLQDSMSALEVSLSAEQIAFISHG